MGPGPLRDTEQEQAHAEKDGQGAGQGPVGRDPAATHDGQHDQRGQPAAERRPQDQHNRRFETGEQVGAHDAGQGSMSDGVTEQGLPPEHGKSAQGAADQAEHGGAEGDNFELGQHRSPTLRIGRSVGSGTLAPPRPGNRDGGRGLG